MGSKMSERRKKLVNGYVTLWEKGMSPIEIADYYSVSKTTMYMALQEIAEKNNLTREELLERKSSPHSVVSPKNINYCKPEIDKIREKYVEMSKALDEIVSQIDNMCGSLKEEFEH